MHPRLLVALLGCLFGTAVLVLQFYLTVGLRLRAGDDLVGALVFFFSYFTILTNLMLALVYLSELVGFRWLAWWRAPGTRAMMMGAIVLVMLFYHLLLAGLWAPEGWFLVADIGLHTIAPTLYILWWLVFQPKGQLRWRDLPWMLLPPALYFGWTLARGAVIGEYPYPVLDVAALGYARVALNAVFLLLVLVGLYGLVLLVDRVIGRRRPAAAERSR